MATTTYDSVLEELIRLTVDHARRNDVTADTQFVSDLALSSLKVMDLMADVEDLFDIEIPLDQLPEIRTVRDAAQQVTSLLGHGKKRIA
jgi:acyl carrier protein